MIPSPDSEDKDVSELLARCESSLTTRNFEEAITGCRAVLNISPENPRAKALMDEAQSKLEAELFARENLRKANEFFKLRNFEKCINECQKVLLLDPDNQECNTLLQRAQEKLEAEPFIQNFISSGRSLFENGLYEEAIAQWEKVRSIDSTYPDLDRQINNAKQMMNPSPVAEPFPSLELTPEGFDPGPETVALPAQEAEGFGFVSDQDRIDQLLQEGDELHNSGQYQKAIEVWSEIFMLDVNHPQALQKIEEARSAAGQQRVKMKDMLKDAQMAYEQGNVADAHDLFKKVKSLDPENTEAAKYLALIERPDREQPSSLEELISLGDSAEQQGKYREAAQHFSQALAVDSENAQLADRIKNLNLLAKKQEQSKTLLGNARAFAAEGKAESARHALSKILESDASNQEALDLLRQLKESAGSAPTSGARARVAAPAASVSNFPVVPVAAGGIFLLLAGIFGYVFFFRSNPEDTQPIPPIKHTVRSKTGSVANQTPGSTVADAKQNKPPLNEGKDQKVDRLVREANFYFHERHYDEALQKAQEALQVDPLNKDAIGLKLDSNKMIEDAKASERKLLDDANAYFAYSEFAGAVKLYEKYLEKHPETRATIQPLILKSYYNLGVIAIREWRCDTAADYFRQVLFIDETDQLSKDALGIARRCQRTGTTDIEVRKAVALMEMRR